MTEEDLKEIDCRADGAIREELLLVCSDCEHRHFMHGFGGCEAAECGCRLRPDQCPVTLANLSDATADFVARAREDVYVLLEEVRRLRARNRPSTGIEQTMRCS